jgi:hypothetical protein
MKQTTITRDDLAKRWKCSHKTIRRAELSHGLTPAGYIGNQPVYAITDADAAQRRITEHKRRTLSRMAVERGEMPAKGGRRDSGNGNVNGVISLAESRRRARKGGAR